LIDAPSRLAVSTAITVWTGCVVTPDAISSDARSASTCAISALTCVVWVCAESCTVGAGSGCTDAEVCTRLACTFCARPRVVANGVASAFALCTGVCAALCTVVVCVLTRGGRRAGLSPSATSIMVLTATAVSMIAGKTQAVAEPYPMTSIRSRSAKKLTARHCTPSTFTSQKPSTRLAYYPKQPENSRQLSKF